MHLPAKHGPLTHANVHVYMQLSAFLNSEASRIIISYLPR